MLMIEVVEFRRPVICLGVWNWMLVSRAEMCDVSRDGQRAACGVYRLIKSAAGWGLGRGKYSESVAIRIRT